VSIFKKITLLFAASLILMLAIGYQMERLDSEKLEMAATRQYLQDARELFVLLSRGEPGRIDTELAAKGLSRADPALGEGAREVLFQPHSFGTMRVLRSASGIYLLEIRYLDDALLLERTQSDSDSGWLSPTLVGLDIVVLIAIFAILLTMLAPLRHIVAGMRAFASGDYSSRAAVGGSDEIAEVAATYNTLAERLQNLIASREELLRAVGHELRTPIARGMFLLEKLPASEEQEQLRRCFGELDRLTGELLQVERLEATRRLDIVRFDAETLILDALSKAMADEERIDLEIGENFMIEGDRDYLSLALKNLIDNALKYADAFPVCIRARNQGICVENSAPPLSDGVADYFRPFRREERERSKEGFGLGLFIVDKVLKRHGLQLDYRYEESRHVFCIRFDTCTEPKQG